MKKILYYNWDNIDGTYGGGVSVYLRNLMDGLLSGEEKYEIFFLNSGLRYTKDKKLRMVQIENSISSEIQSYEILNSPVLAPVRQSLKNIEVYLEDMTLYELLDSFIDQHKFDVIHFHNLEGLSLSVLKLKQKYTEIKFIYSIHNYFPICSRVNMWKGEKQGGGQNCDKKNHMECTSCYAQSKYEIIKFQRSHKNWKGLRTVAKMVSQLFPDPCNPDLFEKFEQGNVAAINQNMNLILAVSDRVRDILVIHGVDQSKIKTSYIGTQAADHPYARCVCHLDSQPFCITYMGYMRREKGFYFLLDALEKTDIMISQNIKIKIIAKYTDKNGPELKRIEKLKEKFASVSLINGYTKEKQQEILSDVNLGIVPVLWEDNLPQVAIEQAAYGVPILVSDLGGAQEICRNENFIFKAGDTEDFLRKLYHIYNHRELLEDFWNHSMHLVTKEEHIQELRKFYE